LRFTVRRALSYKTSLFVLHRICYAMADGAPEILGPNGGNVEVDETYVGGKPRNKSNNPRGRGTKKQCVLALVERGGSVKPRAIANVTAKTLKGAIREYVDTSARILTDENSAYTGIGQEYERGHETTKHSQGEHVRLGTDVHSNTVEGFFSLVKRGVMGIYHNVSKEHLHRYLAEYEFRYDHRELMDGARAVKAIRSAEGKRLMYKTPGRGIIMSARDGI